MLTACIPSLFIDIVVEHYVLANFFPIDIYIAIFDEYDYSTIVLGEGIVSRGGSAASANDPQPNTKTELMHFPRMPLCRGKSPKRTKRGVSGRDERRNI